MTALLLAAALVLAPPAAFAAHVLREAWREYR